MSDEITVPLGLLRRYLVFHGWRRPERASWAGRVIDGHSYADEFFRGRSNGQRNVEMYVLSEAGSDDIELAVPRAVETAESVRRMQGVLETLSQVEGRDRIQVASDVRSIGFDVVKSRIPDDQVYEDTIHLDQAVNYTAGVKKLLAAGATTEIAPDVFFMRVRKEAAQYAEQCRFGHTFKGSFGFTIESPVAPNSEPVFPGMEQSPPFERRVIQRLGRGIGLVQDAVRAEDPAIVVAGYETGFSANMCEEFASLVDQTSPSGLAFGFALSPEWPAPRLAELKVGAQHVEMSRVAAKTMRERTPLQPMEISGRITRLQNEADPQDLLDETHEREIVIYWKSDEFGGLNVHIALAPAEYLAAAEAHMRGRGAQATGRLEKRGRFWWLVEVTAFSA
jgi:hypothetical protein